MKKGKEGKENRRNGANFFKYVKPQSSELSQQSKLHSRSLIDLDANTSRYQKSARVPSNRDNHHASLCTPAEQVETDTIKSQSLKKFLSIFGGPANFNQNSGNRTSGVEEKQSAKGSGRQVFTCNIKNMNVNMTHSKDREHKQGGTLLMMKKDKNDAVNNYLNTKRNDHHQTIEQLKRTISETKQRENKMKIKMQQLQNQNQNLKEQLEATTQQKQMFAQKFIERESNMLKKIDYLDKALSSKQKCREHELIIQSLKKVINQQLKKIIELQKMKIQRDEIEKLEERISKNINIANEHSAKEKLRLVESNQLLKMKRKEGKMIKIQDEYLSDSSMNTPTNELQLFSETIEEVSQSEQRDSCSLIEDSEGDSILEQVDKYLTQWRNKC